LKSIQLSSRSKNRSSGVDAGAFFAEDFVDLFAGDLFAAGFFAAADSRSEGFSAEGSPAAFSTARLDFVAVSRVAVLPARLDFAVGGFFSDIYGTMRLPHPQQEENERRVNSQVPGAPEPALCLP
jgi:hypothetical protein